MATSNYVHQLTIIVDFILMVRLPTLFDFVPKIEAFLSVFDFEMLCKTFVLRVQERLEFRVDISSSKIEN